MITVDFLSLPIVTKAIGARSVTMDFTGQTVRDLIGDLTRRFGPKVHDFLTDDDGHLDLSIRVQLNGAAWIYHDRLDHPLTDGDHVTLMMLVGGG